MKYVVYDSEYMKLVSDIYNNVEFVKIKEIEHHGITRFEHSVRVSYYSYKIAKKLKLDFKESARAGLLHDFFLSNKNRTKTERFLSVFKHPKICVQNALKNFELSTKEIDIIKSHMFPISFSIPKYAESWIVSFVDKGAAIYEFSKKLSYKFKFVTNAYILFLINFIR